MYGSKAKNEVNNLDFSISELKSPVDCSPTELTNMNKNSKDYEKLDPIFTSP